jgi:hypothetical protein
MARCYTTAYLLVAGGLRSHCDAKLSFRVNSTESIEKKENQYEELKVWLHFTDITFFNYQVRPWL